MIGYLENQQTKIAREVSNELDKYLIEKYKEWINTDYRYLSVFVKETGPKKIVENNYIKFETEKEFMAYFSNTLETRGITSFVDRENKEQIKQINELLKRFY